MKYAEFNQMEHVFKNHTVQWRYDVYMPSIYINNYITK